MHGVINLDKPRGLTSQDAVTRVKRALGTRKAGHAGTLDPMATGVLVVCVGEATKLSALFMGLEKEYEAEVLFGVRTDTLDAEGTVVERVEGVVATEAEARRALEGFRGRIEQVPPMYSALKRGGRPLYELARKGVDVEREAREVDIYAIGMTAFIWPRMGFRVRCSKGTYIRTLADDLGRALGTVAHLTALRRTAVGSLRAERAVGLDALAPDALISITDALAHMPVFRASSEQCEVLRNGGFVDGTPPEGDEFLVAEPDRTVFALGERRGSQVKIKRLLHVK
jgi:tRNA pseudouridine55 synthase